MSLLHQNVNVFGRLCFNGPVKAEEKLRHAESQITQNPIIRFQLIKSWFQFPSLLHIYLLPIKDFHRRTKYS